MGAVKDIGGDGTMLGGLMEAGREVNVLIDSSWAEDDGGVVSVGKRYATTRSSVFVWDGNGRSGSLCILARSLARGVVGLALFVVRFFPLCQSHYSCRNV